MSLMYSEKKTDHAIQILLEGLHVIICCVLLDIYLSIYLLYLIKVNIVYHKTLLTNPTAELQFLCKTQKHKSQLHFTFLFSKLREKYTTVTFLCIVNIIIFFRTYNKNNKLMIIIIYKNLLLLKCRPELKTQPSPDHLHHSQVDHQQ